MFFLIKLPVGGSFISIHTANYTLGYNGNWRGILIFFLFTTFDGGGLFSRPAFGTYTLFTPRLIDYTFCTARSIVIAYTCRSHKRASGRLPVGCAWADMILSVLILFLLGTFSVHIFIRLPLLFFFLFLDVARCGIDSARCSTFRTLCRGGDTDSMCRG